METKNIDIKKIRRQLVANIYNLLVEKGYEPEDRIDVKTGLYGEDADETDAPKLLATYSLTCDDETTSYLFEVAYITFFNNGTEFEVYEDNPDEYPSANYATDKDFSIDTLYSLYRILEDIC